MTEMFAQKRNRAKSAYMSDVTSIDEDLPPRKLIRVPSNDTLEVINLDDLPEKPEKMEPRNNRSAAGHDLLYNMIKSDARKVIEKRINEAKPEPKGINIVSGGGGGGSKNIQISNGQLSDVTGPIRLLDKSSKHLSVMPTVMQIARQNAAIASLPAKDKARVLEGSIAECANALNRLEKNDEKLFDFSYQQDSDQNRRTYSRSKSFSAKSKPPQQPHFKISSIINPTKVKKEIRKVINHDQDWQSFTQVLSTNVPKSGASSSGQITPNEQHSNGTSSRAGSPNGIEQVLSWNTNKTLGQLSNSSCIFQRNEFGIMEMDVLSMAKISAMKLHKHEYKNFPHMEPSMACGHSDSAACFDAHVQRINSGNPNNSCKVNGKKPHQFHSIEYKEVFGALVQKKKNNCQTITSADIKEALRETDLYLRTKNSFSWQRFIEYYNKNHSQEEQIELAPAALFVNSIPDKPNTFEIGQKLEAIDPQNSSLFCVCSIVEKCGYRIKLHFDGYPSIYDFWVNADSVNIFPAGWCNKTGKQ